MSITMQIDLPEEMARKARAAGLLEPDRIAGLIARELNSDVNQGDFFELARNIRSQPGEEMTMAELQAEVNAVRAERRRGEVGR